MTRPALVLRPAPGNAATCALLAACGVRAIALPLFAVVPVAWRAPDPAGYDALLLTSANAVRHAGAELARLAALPVVAVGPATAAAASAAGLRVIAEGAGGVGDVPRVERLLHLAGRDRVDAPGVDAIAVYASEALPLGPDALAVADGAVALLHSARAARAFAAALPVPRGRVRVAALSEAVCDAAGAGWAAARVAGARTDTALADAAAALAIDP